MIVARLDMGFGDEEPANEFEYFVAMDAWGEKQVVFKCRSEEQELGLGLG